MKLKIIKCELSSQYTCSQIILSLNIFLPNNCHNNLIKSITLRQYSSRIRNINISLIYNNAASRQVDCLQL